MLKTTLFCFLFLILISFIPSFAAQSVLWEWKAPDDACLSLASLPDISGDGQSEVVAGFDSGKVICLSTTLTSPPLTLWSANVDGCVLALLPISGTVADPMPDIIVSTVLGNVLCLHAGGASAGNVVWSFKAPCGINTLASLPDRNGDGVNEIVAAGADQRVYLRNGSTGAEIWTHFLSESSGFGYVHTVLNAGDINDDSIADIFVLTWDGKVVWALNGDNGNILWNQGLTKGFTDAITLAGDMNGDGKLDFLVGGNDKTIKLCSGVSGTEIWNYVFARPIRSVLVTEDVNQDGIPDCFGVTAGGEVACVSGAGSGSQTALWTAQVGDGCRVIVSPGDINGDGKPDVSVSAENGTVTTFSGVNGGELWQWQARDVVRSLITIGDVDSDGKGDLVAGSIDGAVTLISGALSETTFSVANGSELWHWQAQNVVRSLITVDDVNGGGKDDPADSFIDEGVMLQSGSLSDSIISKQAIINENPTLKSLMNKNSSLSTSKELSNPLKAVEGATDVPILLYHDVLPEMYYLYGVALNNFISQMDLLVSGGYNCVSLDTIVDWIAGNVNLPDRPICITFDGPYDGQYTYAFPILKERGLFATVYCTTDWIGTANHAEWHQMRKMNYSGIENIQNHTINHANLTTLSQSEAIIQLSLCSDSIKNHLNGKIALHHAYPGGAYNSTVMGYLRDLGFKSATTVEQRHVVQTDDPMALPRYSVLNTTTLTQFKQKIRYTGPLPTPTPTPTPTPMPEYNSWLTH